MGDKPQSRYHKLKRVAGNVGRTAAAAAGLYATNYVTGATDRFVRNTREAAYRHGEGFANRTAAATYDAAQRARRLAGNFWSSSSGSSRTIDRRRSISPQRPDRKRSISLTGATDHGAPKRARVSRTGVVHYAKSMVKSKGRRTSSRAPRSRKVKFTRKRRVGRRIKRQRKLSRYGLACLLAPQRTWQAQTHYGEDGSDNLQNAFAPALQAHATPDVDTAILYSGNDIRRMMATDNNILSDDGKVNSSVAGRHLVVTRASLSMELTNTSNIPAYVTLMWLQPRRDAQYDTSSACWNPIQGWTDAIVDGIDFVDAVGNTNDKFVVGATPLKYPDFKRCWRHLRTKKYLLQPGQSVSNAYVVKKKKQFTTALYLANRTNSVVDNIANLTVFPLVIFHGGLVVGATHSATQHGPGVACVRYISKKRYTFKNVRFEKFMTNYTRQENTMAGGDVFMNEFTLVEQAVAEA